MIVAQQLQNSRKWALEQRKIRQTIVNPKQLNSIFIIAPAAFAFETKSGNSPPLIWIPILFVFCHIAYRFFPAPALKRFVFKLCRVFFQVGIIIIAFFCCCLVKVELHWIIECGGIYKTESLFLLHLLPSRRFCHVQCLI